MEPITGSNLQIIENCVTFARKFLLLPDTLNYYFENCPSARFPTIVNACESNINEITFNKPWFLQRTTVHRDDLEFFIFHELRHIHQLYSIELFLNGQPCKDTPETIAMWKQGFSGYVRNIGGASQNANVSQEVEIDANAYAQCLLNLLHIDDDADLMLSLPDEASSLSMPRFEEYWRTKPEIRNFIAAYNFKKRQEQLQQQLNASPQKNKPIRKGRKIGPNEKCPCGSGKKFKQCCRNKGIYD